jgi:hypothetical protein
VFRARRKGRRCGGWLSIPTVSLAPLAEYANSSFFEDPSDRRSSASDKCDWWGQYLAERKVRRMDVPDLLKARLDRYRSIKVSTEKRRQ